MYQEAAKKSWQNFSGFYPSKKRFFSSPWAQLEFFRNCGAQMGGTPHFLKNYISNEMITNSNKSS